MASIWLPHGSAGPPIVRDCGAAATTPLCSLTNGYFVGKGPPVAAICCGDEGYIQVQPSLKSDRFAAHVSRARRNNWSIDRDHGVLIAFGIHGQSIYIYPQAELVIIRMASEATPLDPDQVRGWRRGFDAVAEYFL